MRVLVLGSGVIGTTSAWYLRQAGFEVTVIDRQPGPALETSFANAGQLSFGYTSPWAAPGVPKKAIGWLFEKHAPLAIRPGMDLAQYRWLWQMLRNCTHERYAINKARMVRMSEYSRDCLNELRAQINSTRVFRVLELADLLPETLANDRIQLDPTKVTVDISRCGYTVEELQQELFDRYNIQVEKSTFNTLTLLLTIGTTRSKVSPWRAVGATESSRRSARARSSASGRRRRDAVSTQLWGRGKRRRRRARARWGGEVRGATLVGPTECARRDSNPRPLPPEGSALSS